MELKQSRSGRFSLKLSLVMAIGVIADVLIAGIVHSRSHNSASSLESVADGALGYGPSSCILYASLALNVFAIAAGIDGIVEEGSKKSMAIWGLSISAFVFIGVLILLLIGSAA